MPNNLYNSMNKNSSQNMQNGFINFMNQMRGQDPNTIINQLVSSGKLTQAQLNQVQQKAQQMGGFFEHFKSMFNF